MIAEEKIAAILAAIPGCEFFPVKLREVDAQRIGTSAPFGVYLKVGGEDFSTLQGDLDISRPRMQISIFTTDYATLKDLESAVTTAMRAANDAAQAAIDAGNDPFTAAGALQSISAGVPVDGEEPETDRYALHMDYYVWVRE